jgi:ketosteroid isomerase-like protein
VSAYANLAFMPESSHRRTRELISEVLWAHADPAKCAQYFHDDGVFCIIGRICDYSFSGVFRGRRQITDLFRRIAGEVELSDHRILNLVIDGDQVGLRRSVVVRHRGTAARTRLILGNLVRMRDGKIAEVHEYADTAWLKRLSGDED